MEKDDIEAAVLRAFEVSLEAQLKAIKRLRSAPDKQSRTPRKGMSQVDLVHAPLRARFVLWGVLIKIGALTTKSSREADGMRTCCSSRLWSTTLSATRKGRS